MIAREQIMEMENRMSKRFECTECGFKCNTSGELDKHFQETGHELFHDYLVDDLFK